MMNKKANLNKALNIFLMIILIFSTDCFVTFANVNELYKNIFRVLILLSCTPTAKAMGFLFLRPLHCRKDFSFT